MIVVRLAIAKVQPMLAQRVLDLVARAQAGEVEAWHELYLAVPALTACASVPASESGPTLTSRELEQQLGVSRRTIRRRRAKGELVPVLVGGRGRSSVWPAEAAR